MKDRKKNWQRGSVCYGKLSVKSNSDWKSPVSHPPTSEYRRSVGAFITYIVMLYVWKFVHENSVWCGMHALCRRDIQYRRNSMQCKRSSTGLALWPTLNDASQCTTISRLVVRSLHHLTWYHINAAWLLYWKTCISLEIWQPPGKSHVIYQVRELQGKYFVGENWFFVHLMGITGVHWHSILAYFLILQLCGTLHYLYCYWSYISLVCC